MSRSSAALAIPEPELGPSTEELYAAAAKTWRRALRSHLCHQTRESLARKLGCSGSYVSLLASGKRLPSDRIQRRAYEALSIMPIPLDHNKRRRRNNARAFSRVETQLDLQLIEVLERRASELGLSRKALASNLLAAAIEEAAQCR